MQIVLIVVGGLCSAFIARCLARERGLLGCFSDFRFATDLIVSKSKGLVKIVAIEVQSLVQCPYCLSFWICALATWRFFPLGSTWALYTILSTCVAWVWLSVSGTPSVPDDNPPGIIRRIYFKHASSN